MVGIVAAVVTSVTPATAPIQWIRDPVTTARSQVGYAATAIAGVLLAWLLGARWQLLLGSTLASYLGTKLVVARRSRGRLDDD